MEEEKRGKEREVKRAIKSWSSCLTDLPPLLNLEDFQ